MKIKTKRIVFRAEPSLYDFVKEFSVIQNQSMSDTVRNVLVYFQMGILMGEFKKSFTQMKSEYLRLKNKPLDKKGTESF